MARRRGAEAEPWPPTLARFTAADWPGEPDEDGPEHDATDRQVFAWRRYCEARLKWAETRGLSKLRELRSWAVGERRIRGEDDLK